MAWGVGGPADQAELEWLRERRRALLSLSGEVSAVRVPETDAVQWRGEAGREFARRLGELGHVVGDAGRHLDAAGDAATRAVYRLEAVVADG